MTTPHVDEPKDDATETPVPMGRGAAADEVHKVVVLAEWAWVAGTTTTIADADIGPSLRP